jgi:hypothetical protein
MSYNPHKKVLNCAVLNLFIRLSGLQVQEAIPSSVDNTTGSKGPASYSVGKVVYTTNTGTTGSVIQGIQQPFETSVLTGLQEAKGISLGFSLFSNPTSDYWRLTIDDLNIETF